MRLTPIFFVLLCLVAQSAWAEIQPGPSLQQEIAFLNDVRNLLKNETFLRPSAPQTSAREAVVESFLWPDTPFMQLPATRRNITALYETSRDSLFALLTKYLAQRWARLVAEDLGFDLSGTVARKREILLTSVPLLARQTLGSDPRKALEAALYGILNVGWQGDFNDDSVSLILDLALLIVAEGYLKDQSLQRPDDLFIRHGEKHREVQKRIAQTMRALGSFKGAPPAFAHCEVDNWAQWFHLIQAPLTSQEAKSCCEGKCSGCIWNKIRNSRLQNLSLHFDLEKVRAYADGSDAAFLPALFQALLAIQDSPLGEELKKLFLQIPAAPSEQAQRLNELSSACERQSIQAASAA